MKPVHAVVLLCCVFEISAGNLDLLILHTNDMHAKFEEITPLSNSCNQLEKNRTCVGGFARIAHEIRRYRKWGEENSRKVLFLNGGDTFVGSDWYSVHKWKICSEFLNALQPEAVTLGNHEFDDGLDILRLFTQSLKCPIVTANIDVSKIEPVKKSVVLDINGTKIGIVGYLTRETAFLSNIETLQINEEVKAVKEETEKLDKQGVKIIIGLGHSGFKIDKQLAEEVPLLDVVIGGHSNTFLWNGPKPHKEEVEGPYPTVITQKSGKRVPVVQAYAYTLYLGRLNVTFDDNGDLIDFAGQPEYMSSDIPQDQDILELLEKFRPAVNAVNQEIIGKSSVYLDGMCRLKECNFGNLVTDAMVYYSAYSNKMDVDSWTTSSIALYNAGNIRNSINVTYTHGNISKGELLAAFPFENEIVSVVLKGSVLKKALEHTVENYENNYISAQFLQISGLKVVYDVNQEIGHRVVSVMVRCSNCSFPSYAPLNESADYTVLMTDFVQNGGDGFDMIKNNSRNISTYGISLVDLMLWYFKLQSPVYPEVQGRIQFLNSPNSASFISSSMYISSLSILLCLRYEFLQY
ncbi:hypothetical protein WA026_001289 [Henosepilachna vigintioctopunctata]|uniref:5'-nucleotidase n=1 Tax=Henosepilachna vigintioctopunctata TaxID=420089 RepID=A0AAW1URK4_9CUCU